jgi:hypothetical protein
MSFFETQVISQRVEETLLEAGVHLDPHTPGPVPLHQLYLEFGLQHVALPGLNRGVIREHLLSQGVDVGELGNPQEPLLGFLITAGAGGSAYINAHDILPRRRFTAAHELGHFILHRQQMPTGFLGDTQESILEAVDGQPLEQMEREANQFAVELLMPAILCRTRTEKLCRQQGPCSRTALAYRLSAELLVSREAMRYRLQSLELGDG